MRTINQVFLLGHLGQDPQLHESAGGVRIARFTLATNRFVRQGEGWVTVADWHTVVAFDKLAERAGQFLSKGVPVAVVGELRQDRWQDRDGHPRVSTQIVAQDLSFLGRRQPSLASFVHADAEQRAASADRGGDEVNEAGLPF